jgi:hypothetical protein
MRLFRYIPILACLLGCGGGDFQLPPSMIAEHQAKSKTVDTAVYTPVPGPGWTLDLDKRWHLLNDSITIYDGMTHLMIEQTPAKGLLFDEAIWKRQSLIRAGWKIGKDHIITESPFLYRFQASRQELTFWFTIFVADGQTNVVGCGGLTEDFDHNQTICDELVKHFRLEN